MGTYDIMISPPPPEAAKPEQVEATAHPHSFHGHIPYARATPSLFAGPFDHVVRTDLPAVLGGELGQEVGRGLASALAQAPGGRPEPPSLHISAGDPLVFRQIEVDVFGT